MRRPSYSAVTGVTTVLALICVFRIAFEPLIPPPHPEITGWGKGEFVRRAQTQSIDWRPLGPAAFAEAQRLSRPIIVVVGVPWSAVGRQADEAFASPEVARALNQGFIPIRIDGAQDPRWLSQFLPLQRVRSGFSVGFQAWVFDLRYRLIAFIGRVRANETLNGPTVVGALVKAQREFADAALKEEAPALERDQRADAARLVDPDAAGVSLKNVALRAFARGLVSETDPEWGGWDRTQGLFIARPLTFRFLQIAGETDAAGDALRRNVLSPQADWLDGGFYRLLRKSDRTPEYDKPVVTNAHYAEALAVQDALRPDPVLRGAARRTVEWLLGLRDGLGLVPGGEEGDENARGRSARASFSPLDLREAVAKGALAPAQRDWAEDNLGLRRDGRIAVPTLRAVDDPRLGPVLAALRRSAGPARARVAPTLCDVNGSVAACLLRCARLWNDRALAEAAGEIVDRLETFRLANDLRHVAVSYPIQPQDPYLGDSLAYADASLEDFLTNGRVPSLERGAAELRRALSTFGGSEAYLLRPSPDSITLLPRTPALPQVTDDEGEALSATALRLLNAYATALGPEGDDFATFASGLESRLGGVAEAVPGMGGVLSALARRTDVRAVFAVGPKALANASRLARRLPNRLVVPALGPARPDLQSRPAGFYLTTASGIAGPFTERQATERLPGVLELGG